jgi:subtilisin family serine protease
MRGKLRHWPLRLALATAVGLASVGSAAVSAFAHEGAPPPKLHRSARVTAPSELLVKFRSGVNKHQAVASQGDAVAASVGDGVVVVRPGPGELLDAKLQAYRARPDVLYAEPNYIIHIDGVGVPNDPGYAQQWGLSSINAVGGWSTYPGSFGVGGGATIAIVDTGVDVAHPDLASHVLPGADCTSGTCVSGTGQDDNGHGTHVAGIAAALTNDSIGGAGVAFSSGILPVKVLDSSGSGSYAAVAAGILWAASHGARAINLSLAGPASSTTLCNAVATAVAAGVVVVAAAGNDGSSAPSYPAACTGAIGVAANASDGSSAGFSNYGSPDVALSAPGVGIYSTYWPQPYTTLDGTSMAAPFVTGLSALLVGQAPTRTPAEVERILAQTADKVGASLYAAPFVYGADPYGICTCTWHPLYGYGQINAANALASIGTLVSAFTPSSGAVGSTVTISGSNFSGASDVSLCLVSTTFTVVNTTTVTAQVPAGACDGRWRVTTGAGTGVSLGAFTVTSSMPAVSGFSPGSGPVGSTVTISGSNFSAASDVSLCLVSTTYTVVNASTVTAQVPAAACDGRWRVTTGAGTGVSAGAFTVTASSMPAVSGFSLTTGPVGSTVTISGSNFSGASDVSLCLVSTSFTLVDVSTVTAQVPVGACDGRWRVTTGAGTGVSVGAFTVTAGSGPTVSGFAPSSGGVGSTVTINGSNFSGASDVSLCYVSTTFTVVNATTVTAQVPEGACDGRWRVTTGAGTGMSVGAFTVTGPTISSFSPGGGPVGSTVTITGTGFTGATHVSLCFVDSSSFSVVNDTTATATVPAGACNGRWRVTTPAGTGVSAGAFTVG